ncbi:helix-turn-helix transcriptional regulator [Shimwellia pseudoproteus]|uniref:helix-turn-helix transcriptional regulator n=1 Tax=Shimwellia pseudoproteus TaxID=570012 RepID=UPI0018EC5063|nr:LuxR C-terminal-related transcriptional regulator [Shimwellia pseudoproteus]MBJ3814335.1 helix-turn-helix transcriptional regulator [Shimwellia pseudoproteus]
MVLNSELKKLFCSSCPLHCSIQPEVSPRTVYCASACFCLWPEDNVFFNRGIIDGLLVNNNNALLSGYVFVDFSLSNLHLFVDHEWLDFLSTANLKIILVSDRHLQPLANYWFKNHRKIAAIIYHNDRISAANEKIKKIFIGRVISTTQGTTITPTEFTILSKLISGMSSQQVAESLNLNIRSVYAYRQRIEKHLGSKINKLYANARKVA